VADIVSSRSPYVAGAFVSGHGEPITVIDPATEEPIAQVEAASVEQFGHAIASARNAFDDGPWPRMSRDDRHDALLRSWRVFVHFTAAEPVHG
jgi:aldehyde dehydrogenase (NAD+)